MMGRADADARLTHQVSIIATICSRSLSSMMVNGIRPAFNMMRSIRCASGRYSSNMA